ncbi:MAG TPA: tol-pal system protein YbgF [Xanthomonadales bacterium]|nr:tol-pal system protein YbgF [Xanthomonadales bacterium]
MAGASNKKVLMASLALAIGFSTPAAAQQADLNVTADLVLQVQELQDEVRSLRGQLEEQNREIENLKRRQRDQYLDLDQRISDLRNGQPMAAPAAGAAAAGQGPAPGPAASAAGDVPEVRAPLTTESAVTAIGEPLAQSQAAASSPDDEKAAYDQAFQALKDLRYADAAEEFQAFLTRYPGSDYADNAQYWLGESYYVTRNYDLALKSFQDLLDHFPDSPKAPDALLKIGYTHYELEQWDSARAALTQVQEQYPESTLSRLAENRLRSMRMEGHY